MSAYIRSSTSIFALVISITSIFAIFIPSINAVRVSDKIYSKLQDKHYCTRRLNETHQVGCTSDLGGNFGVVWTVESQSDIDHVLEHGNTPPYIVVLKRDFYTRKNLLTFRDNPGRVNGVVFLDVDHEDSKSRTSPFSPEDVCPNRNSGLYLNHTEYNSCKTNSWQRESPISGALYDDFPYPIFLINDKESIDQILTCFKEHNLHITNEAGKASRAQASYPLCSLQLDSFMMAARDSNLCLNSHFFVDELLQSNGRRCYTVDNYNIFAYYKTASGQLQPVNNATWKPQTAGPKSIVMLVSKLSSISMFNEASPGADSTITSIVTLLSVAHALGRVKNSSNVLNSDRNIAFAILDSEPFDYTGSNRMIFDMIKDNFPIRFMTTSNESSDAMLNTNLKSIDLMVNLDQIANYINSDTLHFHSEPNEPNMHKVDEFYEILERIASEEKVKLKREAKDLPLPPAPVQEFIRQSRNQADKDSMTGLVISNYGRKYNNLFYHSIYDDSHNVFQTSKAKLVDHIAAVSKLVARSLFEITFKTSESGEIAIDKNLIGELLECYLVDAQCHLFTKVITAGQKLPSGPIETYKDPTKVSDDMNGIITEHLLAYFVGDEVKYNARKCMEKNRKDLIYNYEYINGKDEPITDVESGLCIRSQVMMSPAQSPVLSYSESELDKNQRYPIWTVSLNSIRNPVRLYLKPSPLHQWLTFVSGIVITILSFIIVHQTRASIDRIKSQQVDNSQAATST